MKKTTLIIIGISAVVLLFVVWIYLLIYGTPAKVEEFFTDFSFSGGSEIADGVPAPLPTDTPTGVVDVTKDKLRQLTTRPVIGFREFDAAAGTPRSIVYGEAGTGHIYKINLESGEEVRLSNTTIPNAERTVFSPDGNYVAIRSGYSIESEVVLIELTSDQNATAESLVPKMADFIFSTENELLYTELNSDGTTGKALNPRTKVSRNVFTIPFQAVTMIWSPDAATPHYAYPKAAARLNGYLYQIRNGTIIRMPIDGGGLIAEANADYIIYTKQVGTEPASSFFDIGKNISKAGPIIFEPSKCAFSSNDTATLYCGHELTTYSYDFPDDWYKGTRSFSDRIWAVNLETQSATQLVSPVQVAGRDIDIKNMEVSRDATMLYFMNKNDNTLWLYEL